MVINEKNEIFTFAILLIISIIYFICSYLGIAFFKEGFGMIDVVLLEILGNSLIVGIVTYFSTKSISEYLQEKEFKRNNIIEVEYGKTPYKIASYEILI